MGKSPIVRADRDEVTRHGVRPRHGQLGWLRPAVLATCALPVAAAVAAALAVWLAEPQPASAGGSGAPGVIEVVVTPGDSLWSIARRHLPVEVDLRAGVDEIMKLNDMSGCVVRPGEVLLVPTKAAACHPSFTR